MGSGDLVGERSSSFSFFSQSQTHMNTWNQPPDFYNIGFVRNVRAYGVEFMKGPNGFGVYAARDIEPLPRSRFPDCVENVVMTINGQFRGPTIKDKAGDITVVHLKNKLHTEGVVIHWHGITQLGTPWADGTASILQCPSNPEETFVYRFKVDKGS